jgi:hypothetical protein
MFGWPASEWRNYVINTTNLIHTPLSLSLYSSSKSRHVSSITCPSSGGTTRMQLWWLLCAVVNVGWSQDLGRPSNGRNMSRLWTSIKWKRKWSVNQVVCVYYVIISPFQTILNRLQNFQ